jgi:hypothetical protein
MTETAGPRRGRLRTSVSLILIVVATLCAAAGGVTLYIRDEIVDSSAFANRSVQALQKPPVSRVVAREITVQVLEQGTPDLLAARPVIESVLQLVVESKPFSAVFRLAAEHGHRLLFERGGGNAAFDIADAGTVITSAVRTLAPNVAREIPGKTEAVLLTLRKRSFAGASIRFAERVRLLGFLLPPVALALFALAILIAPARLSALTRSAVALGTAGVVFAIALELARRYVVSHVYGTGELTNADVRSAIGALWDSYLGGLMTAALVLSAVAWLTAVASASLLAPYSATDGLAYLRSLTWRPRTTCERGLAGAVAFVLGVFVVLDPGLALRGLAVLAGAVLVFVGAGEVLTAISPAQAARRRPMPRPRWPRRGFAFGLTLAAAVVVAGFILVTGGAQRVHASSTFTCNGYAQLCNRRLDQVVFAGTHNSMSAADSPSWLIPNQDRAVGQQLEDGIRLFKISTHYAEQDSSGQVHTDIAAAGKELNRVAAKLDPAARIALQRLSRSLSGAPTTGKRDIWLCHSLCELGATRLGDFLGTIRRFLALNPNQVIVFFDEDYVREADLQSAFRRAGLLNRLATLMPGRPLPTLAALIRANRNLVVFAQKPPSGRFAWNADAFASWIQDTPLGAQKPAQFNCRRSRGLVTNPLLMLNNWADIFPPRVSPNLPLVTRQFILARARQCVRQRGKMPNLILTDFYDRGDVVGAVAALNGVSAVRATPVVPLDAIG